MDEAARTARCDSRARPPMPTFEHGPVVNRRQYERIQALIESGISQRTPDRPLSCDARHDDRARGNLSVPSSRFSATQTRTMQQSSPTKRSMASPSSIQTKDNAAARRIARQLRGGMVYINEADRDGASPFGGSKQSGNSCEHREFGLAGSLEIKGHGRAGARLPGRQAPIASTDFETTVLAKHLGMGLAAAKRLKMHRMTMPSLPASFSQEGRGLPPNIGPSPTRHS
ncbi:aldehyde dehydrogenase family protein [Rhizobium subbaraonis]